MQCVWWKTTGTMNARSFVLIPRRCFHQSGIRSIEHSVVAKTIANRDQSKLLVTRKCANSRRANSRNELRLFIGLYVSS